MYIADLCNEKLRKKMQAFNNTRCLNAKGCSSLFTHIAMNNKRMRHMFHILN